MSDTKDDTPALPPPSEPAQPRNRRLLRAGAFAAAVVATLGAGSALVSRSHSQDASLLTKIAPTAISELKASDAIAAQGDVAEIYGNKFILQDASGRALIETGRDGEGGKLVAKGEHVAVQGRFEDGFLHASVLTHGDGRRVAIGPMGPPPGVLDRAKERVGIWPQPDMPALTSMVQSAGYSDVRVTGRGPRHLEVVARGADGKDHALHVGFDGRLQDKSMF